MRRVMEDRPLDPVTVGHVIERDNVLNAWKQVRANKGAPGIPKAFGIEEFTEYAHENWKGIKASLLKGTYRPAPVKRVEIPKDNGGTRNLGIPVVMDRVIQSRKPSGSSSQSCLRSPFLRIQLRVQATPFGPSGGKQGT
jgi:hypothetical protein